MCRRTPRSALPLPMLVQISRLDVKRCGFVSKMGGKGSFDTWRSWGRRSRRTSSVVAAADIAGREESPGFSQPTSRYHAGRSPLRGASVIRAAQPGVVVP
jgi:hypothetical protein